MHHARCVKLFQSVWVSLVSNDWQILLAMDPCWNAAGLHRHQVPLAHQPVEGLRNSCEGLQHGKLCRPLMGASVQSGSLTTNTSLLVSFWHVLLLTEMGPHQVSAGTKLYLHLNACQPVLHTVGTAADRWVSLHLALVQHSRYHLHNSFGNQMQGWAKMYD